VLSADIAVPEHAREMAFYSRILTTGEAPLWREDLMNNVGQPIIGLGERIPAYAHLPLQWMPHVQVVDVAASVERALALGGRELMRGASEGAVLLDPNGAAFGIIPVVPSQPVPPSQEESAADVVGRIAWLDLTVPDAPATGDFYRAVVGWSVQEVEMRDGDGEYSDYAMCTSDGSAVAGVCHARGVNRAIPPVWMIYLPVGDLAESLVRVPEQGGEVVLTRTGDHGALKYAVVRDPVGAYLALAPG
jgi:predicted enzyme related to lactoylglutathione lyase